MEIFIYKNLTRIVRLLLAFSKPLSVYIEKQWNISSTNISFTYNCSLCLYLSLFLSYTYVNVIPIHKNGHKVIIQFYGNWGNFKSFSQRHLFIKQSIPILYTVNDYFSELQHWLVSLADFLYSMWYNYFYNYFNSSNYNETLWGQKPFLIHLCSPHRVWKNDSPFRKVRRSKHQCCFAIQISSNSYSHVTLTEVWMREHIERPFWLVSYGS